MDRPEGCARRTVRHRADRSVSIMPADAFESATFCDECGRENCDDHAPADQAGTKGIPDDELEDAVDVAQHGRQIADQGVRYILEGIIPAYGMLGFLVAYTKVGKTTFGQSLAAHLAKGIEFLERAAVAVRVLVLAAEDPPEYTAWLARHLDVGRGLM